MPPEPHGLRAALESRIRIANTAANVFAVATVCLVVGAVANTRWDLWAIAATFTLAGAVSSVRLVTASRIELYQLGRPGPKLAVDNEHGEHPSGRGPN